MTRKVAIPTTDLHKVEYFLKLLPEGSQVENRNYTLWVSQQDDQTIERLLSKRGIQSQERFMVFCPGGNWEQKRWIPERFARLGAELGNQYHQKIVIVGGKKDVSLGEKIGSMMKTKPVILCGETSLKELAALFKRASLVVANDTGPMHVAQSQGTRVIALFGPTSPHLTGPSGTAPKQILRKNVGCNDDPPCYYVDCPDIICMKAIQVEEVLDAVQKNT